MDLTKLFESLQDSLGTTVPSVLGAVAILLIGWIVAIIIRAGLRRGLGFLRLNERMESATGSQINVEGIMASGAFYLIVVVALIAFFNALKLEQVSGSLQSFVDEVLEYLPKLIAGGVLLLVAWLVATIIRAVLTRALGATNLDEKLSAQAGMKPMSESLGNVMYWLIILLFLPAVVGALGISGLTDPVESMVQKMLDMMPNILAGGAIGVAAWFLARILRDLVTNLLAAAGADRIGDRAGLKGTLTISRLVGLLVYIFVFVPGLIVALDALKIEAISGPATSMLDDFMAAIPNIFGAAIILAIAYIVGGFVTRLIASLLGGIGFDGLPAKLGLEGMFSADGLTPSNLVGRIAFFFIMLFAVVEAAGRLQFGQIEGVVTQLIGFGGDVLLGVVIIAVGFWLSGLAAQTIQRAAGKAKSAALVSTITRVGIVGIVLAMGLKAMGLADEIVELAFGLTLGGIAVAFALAFGLGGREAAGKQLEGWFSKLGSAKK